MSRVRGVSHYEADARRNLRDRDEQWLKGYIGRQVVHLLIADDMIVDKGGLTQLGPAVRRALSVLRPLVLESGE